MKIQLGSKKKRSLFLFGLLLGGKQCHAEVHYLKVVEGELLEGGIVMDPDVILPMPLSTLGDSVELSIPHPPANSCDESTIRRSRLLKDEQSSNKFLEITNDEKTISLPSRDSFQQRRRTAGDDVLPRHSRVLKKGSNSKGSDKGGKKGGKKGGSGFKIKFEKNLPGITDVVPEDKYEDTPYKQTGRLYLGNFGDEGLLNIFSWCSASVVGPDILMTAAHCFFNEDLEILWDFAVFCPQDVGNLVSCPKGGYFVTFVIPVDEYLGGNDAFDVVFGKLSGEALFSSTEGPSVNDVTGQGFKLLSADKESETLSLGYPFNIEDGRAMIESLDESFFLDYSINDGLDSYPIMAFGSEMQGGASGGPVLTEKGVIGMIAFGFPLTFPSTIFGPLFGDEVMDAYEEILAVE